MKIFGKGRIHVIWLLLLGVYLLMPFTNKIYSTLHSFSHAVSNLTVANHTHAGHHAHSHRQEHGHGHHHADSYKDAKNHKHQLLDVLSNFEQTPDSYTNPENQEVSKLKYQKHLVSYCFSFKKTFEIYLTQLFLSYSPDIYSGFSNTADPPPKGSGAFA